MLRYTIIPAVLALASCTSSPTFTSPVSLADAIRTLPSEAVAGMSKEGREAFIQLMPIHEGVDIPDRKLHYFSDSPDKYPDTKSMLYLRLFEDESGHTIAASHCAYPFANGSTPSASNTFVYRLENGKWNDITASVLPAETRTWWCHFNKDPIPCGPYTKLQRKDGRGNTYKFGKPAGTLAWKDGAFQLRTSDR